MSSESQNHLSGIPPDAEHLVERVLGCAGISRSPRLRELLAYLCDWTLTRNGTHLTEEQIGVAVFGRPPGYDTTSDTIVRVQISQLRKRLEQHFATEGAHEPVIIELPKRTYAPVFVTRDVPPGSLPEAPPPGHLRRLTWMLATAVLLLIVACVWLGVENVRLRRGGGDGGFPVSDRLLAQVLGNRRPTQIVISDGSNLAVNDFTDHLISPLEYRSSGYPKNVLDEQKFEGEKRLVLDRVAGMNLTTLQDAQVASLLMQRTTALGIQSSLVYARDFRFLPQAPDNLILLGHAKANPWTGLFEERLNFQYKWDRVRRGASIANRSPQSGEQAEYPVQYRVSTYAILALLPKPGGEGAVLLVEGGDMGAMLAAAAMITKDERVSELRSRLGVRPGAPMPWFEVLIRAQLLGNIVHSSEIIAHRLK